MDEETANILKSLGLEELTQVFCDNHIDKEALTLLGDQELKELIPKIGPRLKLKKYLKSTNDDDISFSIFDTDPILAEDATPSPSDPVPAYGTNSNAVPSAITECPRNRDSLDGRAILKEGEAEKGLLKEASRRKLSQLIICNILEENPTGQITSDEFKKLAKEVVDIFPKESKVVFYSAYESGKAHEAKKNASGKLYETYINRRRKLRESGELVGHTRSISRSSSATHSSSTTVSIDDFHEDDNDTLNNENLIWLRNNVDPWKVVEEKWVLTADYRKKLLLSAKGSIADYFKEFPALKQPQGYTLLMGDFARLYPGKENCFFSMITLKKEEIIEYGKKKLQKIRDKQMKIAVNEILGLINGNDPETFTNVALMLLPYVVNSAPSRRRRGKEPWKPSRAEIRDGFIQHVPSEASVTDTIITKRENYQRRGRTIQPYIIVVGKNVIEATAVYAIIDDTVYKFNKLVTALDCTFKIFQATGACYPEEAADIWLFLQLGFYNIKTKYDRQTQAVNTLLTDLGVIERTQ